MADEATVGAELPPGFVLGPPPVTIRLGQTTGTAQLPKGFQLVPTPGPMETLLKSSLAATLRNVTANPWDDLIAPSMRRLGMPVYSLRQMLGAIEEPVKRLSRGAVEIPTELDRRISAHQLPGVQEEYNKQVKARREKQMGLGPSDTEFDQNRFEELGRKLIDLKSSVNQAPFLEPGESLSPTPEEIRHPNIRLGDWGPAGMLAAAITGQNPRLPNFLAPQNLLPDTGWLGAAKHGIESLETGLGQPETFVPMLVSAGESQALKAAMSARTVALRAGEAMPAAAQALSKVPRLGDLVKAYFIAQTAPAVAEGISRTATTGGQEQKEAAVSALMNALFTGGLVGESLPTGARPSGIGPGDIPDWRRPSDIVANAPELRMGSFEGLAAEQAAREQAKRLTTRQPYAPTPLIGETPPPEAPPEPTIIGTRPLVTPAQGAAVGAPRLGGKVTYAAPAQAEAVPSARQAAVPTGLPGLPEPLAGGEGLPTVFPSPLEAYGPKLYELLGRIGEETDVSSLEQLRRRWQRSDVPLGPRKDQVIGAIGNRIGELKAGVSPLGRAFREAEPPAAPPAAPTAPPTTPTGPSAPTAPTAPAGAAGAGAAAAPVPPKRTRAKASVGATPQQMAANTPAFNRLVKLHKTISSLSEHTARGYDTSFRLFSKWLSDHGIDIHKNVEGVEGAIHSWVGDMKDPDSPYYVDNAATLRQRLVAIKSLSTMLRKMTTEDEAYRMLRGIEVYNIKSESTDTRALTSDEFHNLYNKIKELANLPRAKLMRAMTALQFDTVARVGAMEELKMKDIDWTNGRVKLYSSSSNPIEADMSPEAMNALWDYLQSENRTQLRDDSPVFRGKAGKPFSNEQFNAELAKYGPEAGVGHVSSHMLRATRATLASHQGVSYADLQYMGGWKGAIPKTYLKKYRVGDELDPFDPQFKAKFEQVKQQKGAVYDPKSKTWVSRRVAQGQEPRPIQEPGGSAETPPPSGIFQAPQEGLEGGTTERHAGIPLPGDFKTMDDLRTAILELMSQARSDPANANTLMSKVDAMQRQVEEIKARNGGTARTQQELTTLDQQRRAQLSGEGGPAEPPPSTRPYFDRPSEAFGLGRPSEPPTPYTSKIDPENLRPAIQIGDQILRGQPGETHADVLKKNGINPSEIPHSDPRRGFVDINNPDTLVSRVDAGRRSGIEGTADAGGVDSMDLPVSAAEKHFMAGGTKAGPPPEEPFTTELQAGPRAKLTYDELKEQLKGVLAEAAASPARRSALEEKAAGLEQQLRAMGEPGGPRSIPLGADLTPEARAAGVPLPSRSVAMKKAPDMMRTLEQLQDAPFDVPRGKLRAPGARDVPFKSDVMRTFSNRANKVGFTFQKVNRMLMPIDALFDIMEKNTGKYSGWLFQNMRWPLDERFNAELVRRDQYLKPVTDLIKKYKLDKYNGQRIGVYAHAQQEGGIERMMQGGITRAQINDIVNSMDPMEMEVYNTMRRLMDSSLPEVQRLAKMLYDTDVKAVQNYFPWLREWELYDAPPTSLAGPTRKTSTDAGYVSWRELNQDYTMRGTKVEQGFTIDRVPSAESPIQINAFDIYTRHMRDVAHFIEMQESLEKLGAVARSELFQRKFGDAGQSFVLDWLNSIARQGRSTKRIWALDSLRRNTTVGVISWRIASQFVHAANIPLAIGRVGSLGGYLNAFDDVFHMREGNTLYDWMKQNFAETFERGGGERELEELAEVSEKGKIRSKLADLGFRTQKYLDRINSQATVLGVYKRILAEKGLDAENYKDMPFDREAGARARVAARRAVASPLAKDVPLLLIRGGSLARLFTQFQNTFLDQWSNISHDMLGSAYDSVSDFIAGREGADAKMSYAGAMMLATAGMLVVETLIKQGVQTGIQSLVGYQPRRKESFWDRLEHEALRRIPGFSQAYAIWNYDGTGFPALDVVGQNIKRIKEVKKGEEKNPWLAATDIAAGIAEYGAGVPGASQLGEAVGDYLRGASARRPEEEMREKGQELFPGVPEYNLSQRYRIARQLGRETPEQTPAQREMEGIRGERAQRARREELLDDVGKGPRSWLEQHGLSLEGYRNVIKIGGETIRLTRDEQDYLHEQLVAGYKTEIDKLMRSGKLDVLTDQKAKNLWWNDRQSVVHAKAEANLERYLASAKRRKPTASPYSAYQE